MATRPLFNVNKQTNSVCPDQYKHLLIDIKIKCISYFNTSNQYC